MMRARIRFDVAGGPDRGLGHIRRCLTLADALTGAGCATTFTVPPACRTFVAAKGHTVSDDPVPFDVRIVDDPAVTGPTLAQWRTEAPVVCLVDSAARSTPVDLVINGTIGAERLSYDGAVDTRYLLGSSYLLLRPVLAELGERRAPARAIGRVLIACGGGDAGDVPMRVVTIVRRVLREARLDVVVGPWTSLDDAALDERMVVHRDPPDLPGLMAAADLAVTGGGQTAYELAACGTPMIGMRLVDDQVLNLRGLAQVGALAVIAAPRDPAFADALANTVVRLATDVTARATMSAAARRAVDGRGTPRVASAIASLLAARCRGAVTAR